MRSFWQEIGCKRLRMNDNDCFCPSTTDRIGSLPQKEAKYPVI